MEVHFECRANPPTGRRRSAREGIERGRSPREFEALRRIGGARGRGRRHGGV